jgi:hypothetical protein
MNVGGAIFIVKGIITAALNRVVKPIFRVILGI